MLDVYDELADRYGPLPKQAEVLLRISLIRALGGSEGFDKIERRNGSVLLFIRSYSLEKWRGLIAEYKGRLFLSAGSTPYVTLKIADIGRITDEILDLLKKYIQISD